MRCLFALLFFVAVGAPHFASAHDIYDLHRRYELLSPALARELREQDKVRTAARVRGYEAAMQGGDQRQALLEQFGLGSGSPRSLFEQMYLTKTKWPIGHRFRICFFDGDVTARTHVLDEFAKLINGTNLKLRQGFAARHQRKSSTVDHLTVPLFRPRLGRASRRHHTP